MQQYKVVIDLGSQYVSAGLVGDISVKIPSVVAVDEANEIVAVGVNALNFQLIQASHVRLVYPITEGAIVDADCAKALFNELLKRILPNKAKVFSQVKVCVVVPCGLISSDKKNIENILLNIGAKQIYFVSTPVADSRQLFGEFRTDSAIVVNIGAECCDLAVVAGDKIINGCTVYHAGKALTTAIIELVKRKYLVQIDEEQAENFKLNCASLYVNDISTYTISGTNIQTGHYENLSVSSKETYDTLSEHIRVYSRIIESLLASVPDHIATVIRQHGVLLCGGGAKLGGIDLFLSEVLGLPVKIADEPQETTITGGIQYFEESNI